MGRPRWVQDYGDRWVVAWEGTEGFARWNDSTPPEEVVEVWKPSHPCAGTTALGMFQDSLASRLRGALTLSGSSNPHKLPNNLVNPPPIIRQDSPPPVSVAASAAGFGALLDQRAPSVPFGAPPAADQNPPELRGAPSIGPSRSATRAYTVGPSVSSGVSISSISVRSAGESRSEYRAPVLYSGGGEEVKPYKAVTRADWWATESNPAPASATSSVSSSSSGAQTKSGGSKPLFSNPFASIRSSKPSSESSSPTSPPRGVKVSFSRAARPPNFGRPHPGMS
ncbi:hypothetical protein M427DRAFT_268723 [Gonapodya prolifera JEL478]|uniref:Uncharacterized protein n=1 Tax=Gonapodya prolifera (strain JEL478) TaxID=1344416 RepID=A0A139AKP0_GONPJ|nr:hypothetical protein M427DRAFT_268723 [Gonapodya prolifera JEL478]|eukprot:KXS16995.1 hypothetical protein M427DRAFT_268723 [Gonapodya prolifera JEL478]